MIRKKSLIVFLLLGALACKKDPSVWEIRNLSGNRVSVMGHGGMGLSYRYPMNSYESLRNCLETRADGVEMDVCVTRDSVMVLCHSQNLDHETTCQGQIREQRFEEIQGCQLKGPFFRKSDLISAAYFFDRLGEKKERLFAFDCKVGPDEDPDYLDVFANAVVRHLHRYDIVSNSFIESYNVGFLERLHNLDKDLHLFLYTDDLATGLDLSKKMDLYGITIDHHNINAEEIREAHRHQLRVAVFNTRTERDNLEAVAKSPDYIQTDRVNYLLNVLGE
jgi:glycerophosphoryl diester phosphodiesterase